LHLSGSEPRIFPGVVSRTQRRDVVRKGSMSESDDQVYAGHSKRNSQGKSLEGAVEEESDSEMEEAGGMDE
jgi:AMP deaminase